jgi:ribosomal protein L11 methyltransferase
VEALAEALADATGAGVVIEPPIEALGPDEGYVLDERAPLTLRAYIYGVVPAARRAALGRKLRAVANGSLVGKLAWGTLREEDWAEAWKAHYDIERVGEIVIRPAWRDYEPADGETVVSLDPGMAFGTGQHPTTRMCLQALPELLPAGGLVLDLGTGSGILAIAAVLLGAQSCIAIDVEEQAVAAARANAALNKVGDRIEVRQGSTEAIGMAASFDLILANINAATIGRLAGELHGLAKPKGALVAGGIIAERESDCLAALEKAGFEIERRLADGDWRTLIARRR